MKNVTFRDVLSVSKNTTDSISTSIMVLYISSCKYFRYVYFSCTIFSNE